MDSTLQEKEKEDVKKLNDKILNTFSVFVIVFILLFLAICFIRPSNVKGVYDIICKKINILEKDGKPKNLWPFKKLNETLNEFRSYFKILGVSEMDNNLIISLYTFIPAIFFVILYIGFFELLQLIPNDFQILIFGEVLFKEGTLFGDTINNISCSIGAGDRSHFINYVLNVIYVSNIFAILVYFLFSLSNKKTGEFWSALVMFYLFVYTVLGVFTGYFNKKTTKVASEFLISITAISIAAGLLLYNIKAEDRIHFLPGPELNVIKRILLLIPCIYIKILNVLKEAIDTSTPLSVMILSINTLVIVLYLSLRNKNLFKPEILLNKPVYLDRKTVLAEDKSTLEIIDNDLYNKSISFWININKIKDRDRDLNIIKLTDKFKFTYNENYDELQLHVHEEGEKNSEVLFSYHNIPLQKWNNIILNYNKGTIDIFINNELVTSQPSKIIPDILSKIIVGDDDGLNGGICNVRYFDKPLSIHKIQTIYNKSKDKNPPII